MAALDGAVFIENHHRHVLDVIIERITKRDHLDQRREEHEEQGHRIAPDDDEFLEEDGAEATERAFHDGAGLLVRLGLDLSRKFFTR